jgi:hypothetical protein
VETGIDTGIGEIGTETEEATATDGIGEIATEEIGIEEAIEATAAGIVIIAMDPLIAIT